MRNIKTKKDSQGGIDKTHRNILILFCVIFFIYSATLMFPFVWMFFNSVKDKVDFRFRQWELPSVWQFNNYLAIFKTFNIGEMFFNSLILCVAVPTISALSHCCMAYAVGRFKFKGRNFLFYLSISVMFISIEGSLAAQYKLMYDIKLIDTHIGVIIKAAGGFGFNFLLMYAIFQGIPLTYSEAAEIDGAGNWRVFLQIIMPQAIPTISAIWILGFIGVWNDFTTPYLYLQSHPTISLGLKSISDTVAITGDYPKLFATILVTTLPMVVLFLLFQKKIMSISLGGGVKG